MKTEIPASNVALRNPAKVRRLLPALLCCLGLLTILAILLNWQVQLPVCPARAIRVLDDSGVPLQGVRIVEQWGLSVLQQGEIQTTTDRDGWAAFNPVTVPMSMLRRLHITVQPSARGLGYENYGTPRFRVFLPEEFTAQNTPRRFPTSAPIAVPNAHGMAIHEFRP